MKKTIRSPDKPASNKNNGNKPALNKNNNSKPVFKQHHSNNKVDGFGSNKVKYTKKSEKLKKLSKPKKSKSKKLVKSKKLSKSRNSPNFDAKKARPSFSIFDARTIFKYLKLAFTKALIF